MQAQVRVASVVASLSLATDLGTGVPEERALRASLLAVRLGHLLGLDEHALGDTYFMTQLAMLGCTGDSPASAAVFGDEVAIGPRMEPNIFGPQRDMVLWLVRNFAAEQPPLQRVSSVARAIGYGASGQMSQSSIGHCEVAQRLAQRLGLAASVVEALGYTFDRWDGAGARRVKGEAIPLVVRICHLAWDIEVGQRLGGNDASLELTKRHAGAGLDPGLVERFHRSASDVLSALDVDSVWDAALAAEPGAARQLQGDEVDVAASVFADFADLKSSFTGEHSRHVASLAADAAKRCGLDEATVALVRRAGLVHDVGRVSVSAAVWDRPGPLRDAEREQVRLHAYHAERILRRAEALADAGALAGLHHERLDGSGYHRGAHANTLSAAARILGAADAFTAMTESRAFRLPLSPEHAAEELQRDADAGRLDRDAVRGVLEAAGQRARRTRREFPAGLTEREVEVLGLLARGLSMKEIAQRLVVSPKTVDHHVQHVYTKIDARSRAAARLFALEHGLTYDGPLA